MSSTVSRSPNIPAFSRSMFASFPEAHVSGLRLSSCGAGAFAETRSVAVGSSYCAVLSGSSGRGAWFVLSRLSLRASACSLRRAEPTSSTVACGAAASPTGGCGSRHRRVLATRKSRRAGSRAGAAFRAGGFGAFAKAVRANPPFEGTPCRPRSFFVGVCARRPSTSR